MPGTKFERVSGLAAYEKAQREKAERELASGDSLAREGGGVGRLFIGCNFGYNKL